MGTEEKPVGDEHMGQWVYCAQHLAPHRTGWCTVDARDKIPLNATTQQEAYAEVRAKGLKVHGDKD